MALSTLEAIPRGLAAKNICRLLSMTRKAQPSFFSHHSFNSFSLSFSCVLSICWVVSIQV